MDKQPTPIKRHKALQKFSKEHHFGLLLGWKLRQGISKCVSTQRIADYILTSWMAEVWPHFNSEEAELFVLLPQADDMRLRAEQEHKDIKQQIEKLRISATIENLEVFTQMLEKHIRFEERQLFPHIERQQSFEAYSREIEAHPIVTHAAFDTTWHDHFWK